MAVFMKISVRKITLTAVLSSAAIVLSLVESLIPPLPFMPPGAKLGLSNIVTMFCAGTIGLPTALTIAVVKSVFVFLTRGVAAGCMSLAGGLFSTLMMWLVLMKLQRSYVLGGVAGALSHNLAQLLIAYIITSTTVLFYVPFLILFGVLAGLLSGVVLKVTIPALLRLKEKL